MSIAVLTSGGVAPGRNAAVRAVAQAAFHKGWEGPGVLDGYTGLMQGRFERLDPKGLGGTIQRGGSMLGNVRSQGFSSEEGREKAHERLQEAEVDGLVVIGGGGSLAGGLALGELGMPVGGIPATIDNDVVGTDMAIGVDTALNTAVEALGRIKDTAYTHGRAHVVKVLGRDSGYLALMSAIPGDAEAALVPEFESDPGSLLKLLQTAYDSGNQHFIVVVSEGAEPSAEELARSINESGDAYGTDLTSLEHLQSGGKPTAFDRILASRLGADAVEALTEGDANKTIGLKGNELYRTPLSEALEDQRPVDYATYRLVSILAGLPEPNSG